MKQKQQQNETQLLFPVLDYSIVDQKQRVQEVNKIIAGAAKEQLTPRVLQKLANYIIQTHKVKKDRSILTDNRMVTVNKRETSYEELVSKLEKGEDGLYNLITNNTNVLLEPKAPITEHDVQTVPGLKELRDEIKSIEERISKSSGKEKSLLTKQLIEKRQWQYVLKYGHNPPIGITSKVKNIDDIKLDENITINEKGQPVSDGIISLFNPEHISQILCHYEDLKDSCKGKFYSDWWYLMADVDNLLNDFLKIEYPVFYDIVKYKIQGLQNKNVIQKIKEKYNTSYSVEYLSTLWRKKIPKILADKVKKDWIIWHYTYQEYGQWKKCSCCQEVKLAHPYFFTRNRSSKDGWYSVCKECRSKKNKNKR